MRERINRLVKKREAFRPFAPVVTNESARRYFDITPGDEDTFAHMLYVTHVLPAHRDKLPAITHVDGSARVQTVSEDQNPRLWKLLKAFESVTGLPILLNTSFNVKGEPIVCTPQEALITFRNANLDALIIGDYLVELSTDARTRREPELQLAAASVS
jgi:carbamoyltransferase